MADEPDSLGEVTPRKKRGFGTYVMVIVLVALLIGGVVMLTGGEKAPGDGNANPTTPITIPQLKSSVDKLITTVDKLSGRVANLESQMAGLVAPQVTQADIDSLQAQIDTFGDGASTINVSSGLTYWLTKDSDGDVRIHVLSAEDVTLMAEVTLFYDDPILFGNTTYAQALSAFYDDVRIGRDYTPNFIPSNTHIANTTITYNQAVTVTNWTGNNDLPVTGNITFDVPISYNTTTIVSDWEYSVVTFHVGPFDVPANEAWDNYIDEEYLLGYDTIGIRLFPTLEETGGSNGNNGL